MIEESPFMFLPGTFETARDSDYRDGDWMAGFFFLCFFRF